MPDLPISGLPAAVAVGAADEFAINQAGTTKKVTPGLLKATVLDDELQLVWVPAVAAFHTVNTPVERLVQAGFQFADGLLACAMGDWVVPLNYKSDLSIKAVWLAAGSGDAYLSNLCYWHGCGEQWDTHSEVINFAVVAVTDDGGGQYGPNYCVQELTPAVSPGDIVRLAAWRDSDAGGAGVADTVGAAMAIAGWYVSYQSQTAT